MKREFVCLAGMILLFPPVLAELRINELMASNTRAYPDITDFEDYPDWIELHNTEGVDRPLRGIHLSDDPEDPLKWSFPDDAVIPAGGFLVVIADGHDTPAGVSLRRESHWNPIFVTEKHHTNFSLSSSGETLTLTEVVREQVTLVAPGASWSYLDDGSDQGVAWREPSFDDGGWQEGNAPLGYGDPVSTLLSYGPDVFDRHITAYFRTSFEISGVEDFEEMTLFLTVDDGALVYLNGELLVRHNMPETGVNHLTPALAEVTQGEEGVAVPFSLPKGLLVEGGNVVAVEVHQDSALSGDMSFDLGLISTRVVGPELRDTVTFSQQVADVSMGRDENDPALWVNFVESTPGESNSGPLVADLRQASSGVEILPAGGLVEAPVMIEMNVPEGEIYYTLDGSHPSPGSPDSFLYDGAFEISETTVVRARCYAPGKVAGQIATRSYFMGESFSGLPYLSLVADPETLFGDEIGIYYNTHEARVDIGPSVYKGKDAPGHLEFFPEDGGEGFGVNGGIRIGGENNWASHFQRALNFTLRGRYGDDSIDYDLFPGSGIPRFTALTMREGGDDWGQAHLTDGIYDSIVRGRMEVESNRFRPAVLFINGEYWGLYNLRDRWNDDWLFQHYGTNDGEYDRINPGDNSSVIHGTKDNFNGLIDFLNEGNLDHPEVWEKLSDKIDLVSAADFVIAESWGRNQGWGGNREVWRDHRPGGKWRFFIPDMDKTFGSFFSNNPKMNELMGGETIIRRIRGSSRFKRLLAQRYAAHLVTTFEVSRIHGLIDHFSGLMSVELPRQRERWEGIPTETSYTDSIQRMKDFTVARSGDVIAEIQSVLGLDPAVNLTLVANGEGSFEIEEVPLEEGTLQVFPNIGLNLKAVPGPGYTFDGWEEVEGGASLETVLTGATVLTARFVEGSGTTGGGVLSSDTTFSATGSPYFIQNDLIIPDGVTLTVEPGVTFMFAEGVQLRVQGTLNIEGTVAGPIEMVGQNGVRWGGISFEQTSTLSTLSHLLVRNTSRGFDPVTYPAGISGRDAEVVIEFLDIDEGMAPLYFEGGSLILRDSSVRIPLTGDGLNVKRGQAQTIRCVFLGNESPDTDAIDYDGVVGGLIKDCQIYRFFGFNSDGVDIGEQCVDVLIEGNQIYYNSDKGISVGQGSTVISRNNLIVGCPLGIGVKDFGSMVTVDQNTFVDCGIGVSVYEKNFGSGGGQAVISNSIFSGSQQSVSQDSLSTLVVDYSLSDGEELPGFNNLFGPAGFSDSSILDFSLRSDSLARDTGDPAHDPDPNATRADRGAFYIYDPSHYPFLTNNVVVINEVLSNSGADQEDWIEIHNRSGEEMDISGWFLSDDRGRLDKYRLPEGSVLPAGGYLVLYEDLHFGSESVDSGRLSPFSLSDTGETVFLSSASGGMLTDYRFEEDFGPSLEGVSLGYYYKPSTNSYNFVAQKEASPSHENGDPAVGPIVISEIMYQPVDGLSEYLELLNVSEVPVRLYDVEKRVPWRFSDGIGYVIPPNITLQPGERLLLVQDQAALGSYGIDSQVRTYQWSSGKLNNGGETIQLVRPGPLRDDGRRSFVRVDRVKYDDSAPWPLEAGGGGIALRKISEKLYGNDAANWAPSGPSPGEISGAGMFNQWAAGRGGLTAGGDPDGDGIVNLIEYALGTNPLAFDTGKPINFSSGPTSIHLALGVSLDAPDVELEMERSTDLQFWTPLTLLPVEVGEGARRSELTLPLGEHEYFRLKAVLKE